MAQPACPSCRAALEEDLVASTGVAQCPFCGADLSGIDFAPAEESPDVPFEDALSDDASLPAASEETEFNAPLSDGRSDAGPAPIKGDSALQMGLPLPAKSQIEVVESNARRRVIVIPPGAQASGGIGCFAMAWNGFMLFFTSVMVFAGKQGANPPPRLVIVPFVGLFWAVGFGLLYWWIQMKFTRTLLLLERERMVIQRNLFGRKRLTETLVGPETRAVLEVSYEQNDKPIYCIAVNGTNRKEKFGTALTPEEKDWFVDSINRFLGAAGVPAACEAFLQTTGGEVVAPLPPGEIPASGMIVVEDAATNHLLFHLPLVPPGGPRVLVTTIGIIVSTVWLGTNLFFANGVKGIADAVFAAAGLVPMALCVAAVRGRITADLTKERLLVRWHCGRFGSKKELATPSITRIVVIANVEERHTRTARRPAPAQNLRVCLVFAGKDSVPLTTLHHVDIARQAGGLVRYQLEQMGFRVEDD